ncbi:MAG: DNA-binding protein [Thermoplasmata archaeon]|nr:DNA-binding protein [Candidatus Thermoplasmatota archaeon]MCK4948956.1 DNA-binding protein [Thermoplasmata archaeon]
MEEDEELEALRRKRLEQIQMDQERRAVEQEQTAQIEGQRQMVLRKILTPEARERMGRVALAYPDIARGVENQLIALVQTGRVQSVIDDAGLREILRKVMPKKREIKIERR